MLRDFVSIQNTGIDIIDVWIDTPATTAHQPFWRFARPSVELRENERTHCMFLLGFQGQVGDLEKN